MDFYFPCLYRFSVFGKFDICNLYETATFLCEDGDDIGNSEKKMPIMIMIIMVIYGDCNITVMAINITTLIMIM